MGDFIWGRSMLKGCECEFEVAYLVDCDWMLIV